MRFCPFCSAENADEQTVCTACGRRLPPLPPRRKDRNAPPTGVQLPPRAAPPPRRSAPPSNPPPVAPPAAAPDVTIPEAKPYQSGAVGDATATSVRAIDDRSGARIADATVVSAPDATPEATATSTRTPIPSVRASSASGALDRSSPTIPSSTTATAAGFAAAPSPTTTSQGFAPPERSDRASSSQALAPRAGSPTNPPPIPRAGSTTNPPPLASASITSGALPPRAGSTTNPPPVGAPRAGSTTNPPPVGPRAGSPTNPPPIGGPRTGSPTNPPPLSTASGALRASSPSTPPPLPRPAEPDRGDPTVRVAEPSQVAPLPIPKTGVMASPGSRQARAGSHAEIGPPPVRESAPALPPPPRAHRVSEGWDDGRPALPPPRPPSNTVPASAFGDDFHTTEAQPYDIVSQKEREEGGPPPTRIHNPELHADRPFQPPKVLPVPEVPEPGLYNAAKYTVRFARARYQRRGAIKTLKEEIKADTDALDQVLGALGKMARQQRVDSKVFHAENIAINGAEERIGVLGKEHQDVDGRKAEENSKFADIERERNAKLGEAERLVDETTKELAQLEGQRRGLRDKRKELERRQKAYLKTAEDNDKQSGSVQMGDTRAELRRGAEQMRKEAAALEPDRQEVDRRLTALDRPINEATAKLDAAKAELDAAKRSLSDAREGHTHRLAELDAEQKRKSREIAQTEGEIARRLVTLGTLVNLNRVEHPAFSELYQRIDRLRGAITARTTEIEKLSAEREAFDRGTIVRGASAIGGAVVAFIALIVILRAIF